MRIENVITEREIKSEDTLPTYVLTTKFNIDKVWLRVEIKNNKSDEYEPFDNIKKSLLNVVKRWQDNGWVIKSSWRYEFVDLILKLYTEAVAECEDSAYKVEVYEAVDQIWKYIDKNKKKIETLERLKKEKQDLDKEIKEEKNLVWEKNKELEKITETNKQTEEIKTKEVKSEKPKRTVKKKVEDKNVKINPMAVKVNPAVYDNKNTSRCDWIF